jgi:hypothetical protein
MTARRYTAEQANKDADARFGAAVGRAAAMPLSQVPTFSLQGGSLIATFSDKGDFAASGIAELFLRERGFSVGPMQANDPRGIMLGKMRIEKWRRLTDATRAQLHGQMTGNPRTGPITVTIFAHAPAAAREAFSRAA